MRLIALLCALTAATIPSAQAADGTFSVNLGLDYSSGKYGSSTATKTWALPLSLKYRSNDWSVRLSTAWLRVQGDGNVTPDGDPLSAPGSASVTEGMGDISASATYNLVDERTHWAGLDLGGKIKFGTASVSKFLGTGENDYTVQAELFKPIDKWSPFLSLGYKWKGDPAAIQYRNVWLGSVGTDYPISEAMLYLNFQLAPQSKLNLYAVGGFSNASPDWGSGLTFSHRY
jgi:opacity protein-like surface antigen